MSPENNTCDHCGKTDLGISWFARAFRNKELREQRSDPGNLCGDCAGRIIGPRIAQVVLDEDKCGHGVPFCDPCEACGQRDENDPNL